MAVPRVVFQFLNLLDDEKAQTSNKNCGDNQWNLMQMLPFVFQPLYFNSFFLYF